ncbi:hypothetical protein QNE21_001201, partial [Vibrio vulnificus]|nr:hypothetical protein [Vibrio vulnificus]
MKMIIDDIIAGIDEGGPKSYYSFETFVQHLLKYHIENQGKQFLLSTELARFGDAFAPEGFDQFDGATLIEIKFNLSRLPIRQFVEKSLYRFINEYTENKFEYVLIISAKPIPDKFLHRFYEEIERNQFPFKVLIWGPS